MRRILALMGLLALVLTGCTDTPERSTVEPVALTMAAPTYAAATEKGLLLRSGKAHLLVKDAMGAQWLPDGRALVSNERSSRIWDPRTGKLGPRLPYLDPNRSVTQIDELSQSIWGVPTPLVARGLDGRVKWRAKLPLSDRPDAKDRGSDVVRAYLSAHTIDGTTFLRWHDGSEDVDGDYGLLLVGPDGKVGRNVQVGTPIIATWLSADGSTLLATRRTHGRPCGGCQVTQRLVELDPRTGETTASYDLPDAYTKDWDIREVDKVGDKVVVRFEEQVFPPGDTPQQMLQRGTWVLDGDGWTMVPGSDKERSWWQGPHDRVIAIPVPGGNGYRSRYVWEHDGKRTPLAGFSESDTTPNQRYYYTGSVPGQLVAP